MSDFHSGFESGLQSRVIELEERVDKLESRLGSIQIGYASIGAAFYDYVWKSFARIDFAQTHIQRYIPVRIYLDKSRPNWESRHDHDELLNMVFRFLSTADFYFLFELPDESGSWKKFTGAISRWLGTEEDGKRRLKELEQAAVTVMLDKPIAEVTKMQAKAAADVIDKVKDYDAASIQFGNMMLLKRTMPDGRKILVCGPLSASALKKLEENHTEQIKPEIAHKLLESSGHPTVVDQEKLRPPPPNLDDT
jgi:hypothetical protein